MPIKENNNLHYVQYMYQVDFLIICNYKAHMITSVSIEIQLVHFISKPHVRFLYNYYIWWLYQIDTFFNLNIFNLYIFLHIIITQEIIVKVFGHVVVHQVWKWESWNFNSNVFHMYIKLCTVWWFSNLPTWMILDKQGFWFSKQWMNGIMNTLQMWLTTQLLPCLKTDLSKMEGYKYIEYLVRSYLNYI